MLSSNIFQIKYDQLERTAAEHHRFLKNNSLDAQYTPLSPMCIMERVRSKVCYLFMLTFLLSSVFRLAKKTTISSSAIASILLTRRGMTRKFLFK